MSRHNKRPVLVVVTSCITFLLLHLILPITLFCDGLKRLKFEHLTIEDGLPQNSVFCICQDKTGFLWLGTEDGLCRYDGYTIKTYQYDPEKQFSISNNRIHCIKEDKFDNLWIGTDSGLNRFDRIHEQFIRFKHDSENPEISISNDTVRAILEDHQGNLWIGTDGGGLHLFIPIARSFYLFKIPSVIDNSKSVEKNFDYQRDYNVNILYEDSNQVIWVGTSNGLFTFEQQYKRFTPITLPKDYSHSPYRDEITAIFEDRAGILWVGTKSGILLQKNPSTGQFMQFIYDPEIPKIDGEFQVLSILEDKKGDFWVGVYNAGLFKVNRQTKSALNYTEHPWIPDSLSSNHIYTIYQDSGEIIWIGTEDGLNKLDKKKNEFIHWTTEAGNKNSLSDNNVWSLYKDNSGILWVGTDKGLNKIDRQSETFQHYRYDPKNLHSLSNDRVMAILQEDSNTLWVGTQGGGLNRLDIEKDEFTRFLPDPNDASSISHERVTCLAIDSRGNFWIGTGGGGLNRFHRDTESFSHFFSYSQRSGNISDEEINCIYEDKIGNLWIGTNKGGLNFFHHNTATFSAYTQDTRNPYSLSTKNVSTITEDHTGTLWIGTYDGGLNQLIDLPNGTFKHFRKKDGLPNDTIFGLLADEQGNLWISTVNGLSKFDPQKNHFKNYFAGDGIQSNEFNGGAFFKAKDGEMLFGGMNGFNTFYPGRINDNPYPPNIVITNFQIFGKPYKEESITEMDKIILSYNQDVFSIEFAALDFSSPGKNQYKHQMKGVDPDWVTGNAKQRTVNYTKLSPGEYEFTVTGSNNDLAFNSVGKTLTIIITPPLWQRWWFRGLMFIFLLLLILAFHLTRTELLRKKLAEQKHIQEILKESHDEMERARDLAELRHAENEKLLSSISSIFIAVDSNEIIFQWNKSAENFFDIPASEAEKKPLSEILKNSTNETIINEIIEKGLKQDQYSKLLELNIDLKVKGKGIRVLAANISPILDSTGRKLGFLFMADDITNRKEQEMLSHLSRKLESLGQMASSIAHEIKTPLQYIGHNAAFVNDSFTEVAEFYRVINDLVSQLKQSDNPCTHNTIKDIIENQDIEYIMKEIPTAAAQIISGVSRVSNIIQAMNEFSHPGRGYKEKADINQLLKTTLVMVQSKIKKNADIQMELDEDLPQILCFAGELNQVFMNLLINALDAIIETGRWGRINISTQLDQNDIVISIADTGCGIPEKHKDNIFTPFFTTKEMGKGTGQGLSLAHNVIIEKHKGRLSFSSQLGKGTTFYIRLPI